MATRMLIDARHPEETRVAVLKGNRIEEFDFESADHKQIKGNIYLAKVTRVEPSLQAAFVDFGGNRHGFLPFNEIHPDYYQIPQADREALLAEEAAAAEEEARLRAEEEDRGHLPGEEYDAEDDESAGALVEEIAEDGVEEVDTDEDERVATIEDGHVENGDDAEDSDDTETGASESDEESEKSSDRRRPRRARRRQRGGRTRAKEIDEARARRLALRRRYKIQDVIQRRQVLLVQVVKEERGNKGAALTTYLSLAGRYTVLMPNSSHGGGISRKISSAADRKRLKQIVADLKLPKTMGLIVRTAGLSRTKTEIRRDFDYLARLWDEIREKTLASTAPALIHSDSDLIKRAIRDVYSREIDEVIVEGEEGYKAAKSFMKLLMPSHARKVKAYNDPVPLFQRYGAEDQLRAMYDPMVQLKSGGYLIINPTEALVSIDINSGRSTKEHGIEQTALATNLEAAEEIARQLRLRDMAGLIVIDFIDMEYSSNVRKVERALKEALKNDRARIQVGRISSFGLLEMSRQRLRTGVLEATTRECPHCDGTGLVRTASSAGLSALRLIEEEAAKGKGSVITLAASTEAAIYLLNQKREDIVEIEDRYGVKVEIIPEGENEGAKMRVASSGPKPKALPNFEPIVDDEEEASPDAAVEPDGQEDENRPKKKRRRRRGGRGRGRKRTEANDGNGEGTQDEAEPVEAEEAGQSEETTKSARPRRRKDATKNESIDATAVGEVSGDNQATDASDAQNGEEDSETTPKRKPRGRAASKASAPKDGAAAPNDEDKNAASADEEHSAEEPPKAKPRKRRRRASEKRDEAEVTEPTTEEASEAKPKRRRRKSSAPVDKASGNSQTDADQASAAEETAVAVTPAKATEAASAENPEGAAGEGATAEKPRRGWWQRTFGEG